MAQYRVLVTSFINNKLVQPDEIVDYDGEASDNLELIPDQAPAQTAKTSKAAKSQPAAEDPLV